MKLSRFAAAALTACLMGATTGAMAVENGPAPTMASITKDGSYAITSTALKGSGFGSATIHVPNGTGPFALVAVCPGFVSPESSITAISKRLATHGFVVVTIGTTTPLDFPSSRASQILAALKAAVATNNPKIDVSRQVASGWSMGGGGTLEAAASTPGLVAAVAYAPWNTSSTKYKSITVPSLILGGTADTIAPVSGHSQKFYDAIPASTKKMLAVIQGAGHFFPNSAGEPQSYTNISWVKRFADGDTRFSQFLNTQDPKFSTWLSTGPF